MPGLKSLLAADTVYKRVKRSILNADEKVDSWIEELMTMQASRGMRALRTNQLLQAAQHVSIETNIENQAVRSRCTELKMRAFRQEAHVDEKYDYLRKYIMYAFRDELAEYKTITERKGIVDAQLSKITQVRKRLNNVTKLADMLIDDCDAAGYTLKRIGDALNQVSKDR